MRVGLDCACAALSRRHARRASRRCRISLRTCVRHVSIVVDLSFDSFHGATLQRPPDRVAPPPGATPPEWHSSGPAVPGSRCHLRAFGGPGQPARAARCADAATTRGARAPHRRHHHQHTSNTQAQHPYRATAPTRHASCALNPQTRSHTSPTSYTLHTRAPRRGARPRRRPRASSSSKAARRGALTGPSSCSSSCASARVAGSARSRIDTKTPPPPCPCGSRGMCAARAALSARRCPRNHAHPLLPLLTAVAAGRPARCRAAEPPAAGATNRARMYDGNASVSHLFIDASAFCRIASYRRLLVRSSSSAARIAGRTSHVRRRGHLGRPLAAAAAEPAALARRRRRRRAVTGSAPSIVS